MPPNVIRVMEDTTAAIEAIYRSDFDAFTGAAMAIVRDREQALDAVQEGFARALRQSKRFRGDGSLRGWIWRIVLNEAHDQLRRRKRLLGGAPSVNGTGPTTPGLPQELHKLPDRQRLVIFLRYYADLDYATIAEMLGVAEGTVAATLNAARTALRRRLEEDPE